MPFQLRMTRKKSKHPTTFFMFSYHLAADQTNLLINVPTHENLKVFLFLRHGSPVSCIKFVSRSCYLISNGRAKTRVFLRGLML